MGQSSFPKAVEERMGEAFLGEDGASQLWWLLSMACSLRDFLFYLLSVSEVYKMSSLGFRRLDFKAVHIEETSSFQLFKARW